MYNVKPTASLFLDTRRMKKSGLFPLKLQVHYQKQNRFYNTGIDMSEEDWIKLKSDRIRGDSLKQLRTEKSAIIEKAQDVLDEIQSFSFEAFETLMFPKSVNDTNTPAKGLKGWFDIYLARLEAEEREGTRSSYNTTINSILAYTGKTDVALSAVTKDFLVGYEKWMVVGGKSASTQGIYLRQLRAVINFIIAEGGMAQDKYPFKGYTIPAGRNVKKALDDQALKQLLAYQPTNPVQQRAFDFWRLSYYCNGMNMTDILNLKPKDVSGNFLQFIRQKTKRTKKKDLRPIKVYLAEEALSIIEKWRSGQEKAVYLFPMLEGTDSPKTLKQRCKRFIKLVNEGMKEIGTELKIDVSVTTYAARHSFATRMMRSGVPTQFIKDSLGHSSVAITENYLGDFADDQRTEYNKFLNDF